MIKNTEKYRRVPLLSPSAAASLVPSAGTVCFCGAGGGIMEPTAVIEALAKHFDECGEPKNLTIVTTTGLGDRAERGISPLAKEGLCKRPFWAIGVSLPESVSWRRKT